MLRIRPIDYKDFESLTALAFLAGAGLLSMPKNPKKIYEQLEYSINSFSKTVTTPADEFYLFVLEDCETKNIIGFSGIKASIGSRNPLYNFFIEETKKKLLVPTITENGPSEMCALFLEHQHRKGGIGRLLSFSRFLFIAEHLHRFKKKMVAAMRGVINKDKHSPFWDGIGNLLCSLSFEEVLKNLEEEKDFIPSILPNNPMAIDTLPTACQEVIGIAHPNTEPAIRLLTQQGFSKSPYIDIFDAGPFMEATTQEIKTIKESLTTKVTTIVDNIESPSKHLIANPSLTFRATIAPITINDKGAIISSATAEALEVAVGDKIRYSPIFSNKQ